MAGQIQLCGFFWSTVIKKWHRPGSKYSQLVKTPKLKDTARVLWKINESFFAPAWYTVTVSVIHAQKSCKRCGHRIYAHTFLKQWKVGWRSNQKGCSLLYVEWILFSWGKMLHWQNWFCGHHGSSSLWTDFPTRHMYSTAGAVSLSVGCVYHWERKQYHWGGMKEPTWSQGLQNWGDSVHFLDREAWPVHGDDSFVHISIYKSKASWFFLNPSLKGLCPPQPTISLWCTHKIQCLGPVAHVSRHLARWATHLPTGGR